MENLNVVKAKLQKETEKIKVEQNKKKECKGKKAKKIKKEEDPSTDDIDPDFSLVLSKVINENMESAKEEIIKKTLKEASKMFEKMKKSQISSSMMSSTVIHSKVSCDGCKMSPIIGNRYKCTICENFDYCESCEEKNSENHKHPFLKIRKPESAPINIVCAINDDNEEFLPLKKLDDKEINPSYVVIDEKPKDIGFLNKIKETFTKDIPNKAVFLEDVIKGKVKDLFNPESDERKKISIAYQNSETKLSPRKKSLMNKYWML